MLLTEHLVKKNRNDLWLTIETCPEIVLHYLMIDTVLNKCKKMCKYVYNRNLKKKNHKIYNE